MVAVSEEEEEEEEARSSMIKSTTFMMEISLCAIIFRRARSVGWSELCSLITLFFILFFYLK